MASRYFIAKGLSSDHAEIRRYEDGVLVEEFHGSDAAMRADARLRSIEAYERANGPGAGIPPPPQPPAAAAPSQSSALPPQMVTVRMWAPPGGGEPLGKIIVASKTGLFFWFLAAIWILYATYLLLKGSAMAVAEQQNQRLPPYLELPPSAAIPAVAFMLAVIFAPAFGLFLWGLILHYLKSITISLARIAGES